MTVIPFTPNATQAFSSLFTLDNVTYTGTVTWNVYAQRWYLILTDAAGNVAWNGGLVASPDDANIYLAPGVFTTSTLLFRDSTNQFEVEP